MDKNDKEIITNKTSLITQPGGLASRGLQIANKLAQQNAKTVKQLIDEQYFTNSLGMKFRLIPAGTFIMGSPETEKDRRDNEAQHQVAITKAFWIGTTQVTQAQYEKVIGNNPSCFQSELIEGDSSNHPVECVTWHDVMEFCKRLSKRHEEEKAGFHYRLPTEAEWEYACRAGSESSFSFGERTKLLGEYAWFWDNCDNSYGTHPVGMKKPNTWGLYDMHGNVFEWCADWASDYPTGSVVDPMGPAEGWTRVNRGGSFGDHAADCRSAYRNWTELSDSCYDLGFRLALSCS